MISTSLKQHFAANIKLLNAENINSLRKPFVEIFLRDFNANSTVTQARRFAVARSAAKAHLRRIEEGQLQATHPRRPVADTSSSQDSESRHHESQEARPIPSGR